MQFHETLQLHPVERLVSALDEVYHDLDGLLQFELLPDVRVKLWISVKLYAAVHHYGRAKYFVKESDVVYGAFVEEGVNDWDESPPEEERGLAELYEVYAPIDKLLGFQTKRDHEEVHEAEEGDEGYFGIVVGIENSEDREKDLENQFRPVQFGVLWSVYDRIKGATYQRSLLVIDEKDLEEDREDENEDDSDDGETEQGKVKGRFAVYSG